MSKEYLSFEYVERLQRTDEDYKKFKSKYDTVGFLNMLLERANIEIRVYSTKINKHMHVYDYEESEVMFKTERETLDFVLDECGLEMNLRNEHEEKRLEDLNILYSRAYTPDYLRIVNIVEDKDTNETILYIQDKKNNHETDDYVEYYSDEQARNTYGDMRIDMLIKEYKEVN